MTILSNSDANVKTDTHARCRTMQTTLPPELLVEIFELATDNSTRDIDPLSELPPFERLYTEKLQEQDKEAIGTKYALALTCSFFRKLTTRLLYEDMWIRHGSSALLNVLLGSCNPEKNDFGLGKFVKRISLSPLAFGSSIDDTPRVLSLCPNIRILSRPLAPSRTNESDDFTSLSSILSLSSHSFTQLHRIDWNDASADGVPATDPSPPFVWHSPTLRVLTLGSDNFPVPGRDVHSDEDLQVLINLPQLHTLRICSADALGDPGEFWFSVQLPSLHRIVLERPLALYALHAGCLSLYGTRITTLELGMYPRFLRIDAISIALGYCPNTETLLFPVFTTMPPAKNHRGPLHTEWIDYRVKHIGLNASVEDNCDYQVSRTWMWVQLGDLVDALTGDETRFKVLECVTLYGSEWRDLVQDAPFSPIAKAMRSRGIKVKCEDRVTGELVVRMLE